MRVLVVHNEYSSRVPSGENLVVHDDVKGLRAAGVDVHLHTATNDDIVAARPGVKVRRAAEAVWSLSARQALGRAIADARPDIVHVHNAFPLITASAPSLASRLGVPVAWTVHNRRVVCVQGTCFRAGAECHLCTPANRLPGIRYACYGGSRVATTLVTAATSVFASLARRRFTPIAVSHSVKDWLVDTAGFPADRVEVRYNGIALPAGLTAEPAAAATNRAFVFAGHLAAHKGLGLLLAAWRRAELPADVELRLAGDGPLADDLRRAAKDDPRIQLLGPLPPDDVARHLCEARAVVVPSLAAETFGRVAAEAHAAARPVVTTGAGGLAEVVTADTGWLVEPEPDALARALEDAARRDEGVLRRAHAAHQRYDKLFSPVATTNALVEIYERCIG